MSQKATLVSSFPVQILAKTDKVIRDIRKAKIRDILVLREDRIILSDFSNGVKCFEANGTPLSKLRNPSPSTAMTSVSDTRIAFLVPFQDYPETVFVDVDLESGSLDHVESVHTPINYRAIASIDDKTWAAGAAWWNGAGVVNVLNKKGEILRSYNHPDERTTLLKSPISMVVSPNGDFVVCDENAVNVVWVNPSADGDNPIRFIFDGEKEEKLESPCGLTCDSHCRIYVVDSKLNHVVVLSSEGNYIQTIVDSVNGELCKPSSVYVYQDKLYVAETEGSVKVFQLSDQ